jgi:hypothetical protein
MTLICTEHPKKKRYRSHREAVRALHLISTKGDDRQKTPRRVYECENCLGYHLTSQETWGKVA